MTEIADRRVKSLMVRTAGEPALHVVNDAGAVDKRAVHHFVAQIGQTAPAGHVGLRKPKMIDAETAAGIAVAEHHLALAHGFVALWTQRWETRGCGVAVRGGNIKRDDFIRRLADDGRAENAVASNGIAARAVVLHWHGGVTRPRINPVIKREAGHAIRIM